MLTIALKELIDALRDRRSIMSSAFYCLMGPAVIWIVSLALQGKSNGVLSGMISVFVLVSAFSGGMNVAMDVVAGERERKSLLPLLGNPVSRSTIVLGKWASVAVFCLLGLLLSLAAFSVFSRAELRGMVWILITGLGPLCLMAAALELGISTFCRSTKEAHTYLSMLVFVPMVIGIASVFYRAEDATWIRWLPIAGQQWQLERWLRHETVPVAPSLLIGALTAMLGGSVIAATAWLLKRDDVVYGS
jgi:sodium transport system permease protein